MAKRKLFDVSTERHVAMKMRDGVELRADIHRPNVSDPLPVLLIRLPYDKSAAGFQACQLPEWYARHGYIVVSQDTRGRFLSGGNFRPFHHEAEDGVDTIEHCARLPQSNGMVGMYGFSYAGQTQLQPAIHRPKGLAAMAPAFTADGMYEDWNYKNGALHLAFVQWWASYLAIGEASRKGSDSDIRAAMDRFMGIFQRHDWLPLGEHPSLPKKFSPFYEEWLRHHTFDAYWRAWSIAHRYAEIDVPALHIAGWYDIFIDGNIRNFSGLAEGAHSAQSRRAQKLVIGPWYHLPWAQHTGQLDFGEAGQNHMDELMIRWFDFWLKGRKNGIMKEHRVSLFVMGANRWRHANNWPLKRTRFIKFYFHSEGRANSLNGDGSLSTRRPGNEPHDIFVSDPSYPVPSMGGQSCCLPEFMGPHDQRQIEVRNDVLIYTSAPLVRDVDVIGPIDVTLHAASSAEDTDFTVKLVDVHPDGPAINLVDSIQRASFRGGNENPQAIKPDEVYSYSFRVGNTANRFKKGHCIRVEVASSNFPIFERNLNRFMPAGEEGGGGGGGRYGGYRDMRVARQRLFHDAARPSHITLPFVPLR